MNTLEILLLGALAFFVILTALCACLWTESETRVEALKETNARLTKDNKALKENLAAIAELCPKIAALCAMQDSDTEDETP
jgi:hypothetical protein